MWADTGKEQRFDATKVSFLSKLPPTLVINLKRFDMDYETFQPIKLNHRVSFDRRLDLTKYTKEAVLAQHGIRAANPSAPHKSSHTPTANEKPWPFGCPLNFRPMRVQDLIVGGRRIQANLAAQPRVRAPQPKRRERVLHPPPEAPRGGRPHALEGEAHVLLPDRVRGHDVQHPAVPGVPPHGAEQLRDLPAVPGAVRHGGAHAQHAASP